MSILSQPTKNRKWLPLPAASEYCGLGIQALRNFIASGELEAYKPGKFIFIKVPDLDRFMERSALRVPKIK